MAKKLCVLVPSLFEQTRVETIQTQVPTLLEMGLNLLHIQDGAFCGTHTYTIKKISNHFHIDNDHNFCTFEIWASICLKSSKLLSKENGFQSAKRVVFIRFL